MDTTYAIANFAVDYHGGQSSRGYRLLCRLMKRLRRHGCSTQLGLFFNPANENQRAVYDALEKKYGNAKRF